MRDFATSDNPEVQAQLDRLAALSQPQGRIGIVAIRELLTRLGDPHLNIPPAFHVAGTNGTGSTCAFLRAMLEAEGYKVHATISPHLVRYNERIRIAGKLIEDAELAALLKEVLDTAGNLEISFFEATIATAFLAFARHPADACVIETGLGGRLDATNVMERPAVCGIATLGIDHERFLLAPEEGTPAEPLPRIAWEKAGIAKEGVPLVTQAYPPEATREIVAMAKRPGTPLVMRGQEWAGRIDGTTVTYRDENVELALPMPALPGAHQADNALLAVAMLVNQDAVPVDAAAMGLGIRNARWPARLQLLADGPLTALAPGRAIWLDGGHNPDAGAAIARHFAGQRLHVVLGMLANKDTQAIIGPLRESIASLQVVPLSTHDHHRADAFGPDARAAGDAGSALSALPADGLPVLIAGSLYLAGEVLRANGELPD
jgi:dihydrofolate synthase/folylpolyglutamate synthase